MPEKVFDSFTELKPFVGQEIAISDWLHITQSRIDAFAAATDDHQWIHTDPARAAVESPYKNTIAHGLLTLSLVSPLWASAMTVGGARLKINYGFNRVRFTGPVLCDESIRGRFTLQRYEDLDPGAQLTWNIVIEKKSADKPVCVAEWITRCYV
jgi:acyl dehydratase